MLQCVAVCCSVLQSRYTVLQWRQRYSRALHPCSAVCCRVLQRVAACCSVLQTSRRVYDSNTSRCYFNALQCVAACCSVLQRVPACCRHLDVCMIRIHLVVTAVRCSVLQCIHRNTYTYIYINTYTYIYTSKHIEQAALLHPERYSMSTQWMRRYRLQQTATDCNRLHQTWLMRVGKTVHTCSATATDCNRLSLHPLRQR